MNSILRIGAGAASTLASGIALAQNDHMMNGNGNMMNGNGWGSGWMGGYGGYGFPALVVGVLVVLVVLVVWVVKQKGQ